MLTLTQRWKLVGGILALGALLVSWGRPAHAVTISQLLPEFTAKPGDTIEQVVQLYDDSMQGVTVYPTVYNFTADPDKEGAVLILTDPKDFRPDREWLKFDQTEVTLPEFPVPHRGSEECRAGHTSHITCFSD